MALAAGAMAGAAVCANALVPSTPSAKLKAEQETKTRRISKSPRNRPFRQTLELVTTRSLAPQHKNSIQVFQRKSFVGMEAICVAYAHQAVT
jgi:hypothetical protein